MIRDVELDLLEERLRTATARAGDGVGEVAAGLEGILLRSTPESDVARRTADVTSGRRALVSSRGGLVGNLVDAYLLIRLLRPATESARAHHCAAWQPFIEATLSGVILPTPAVPHGRWAADPTPLGILHGSLRDYFCVGVFWCKRAGIPRSWLVEAYPVDSVRAALYIALRMRGFRPVFSTHIPSLPPGLHLTERTFVQSHIEIADALRRAPDVLGLASSSWFYDPALSRVSPHLEFVGRILRGNGCLCFQIRSSADMHADALSASRSRQSQFSQGAYTPRTFARLWSRRDLIGWAERQTAPRASRS
jgi:hypothetical protein